MAVDVRSHPIGREMVCNVLGNFRDKLWQDQDLCKFEFNQGRKVQTQIDHKDNFKFKLVIVKCLKFENKDKFNSQIYEQHLKI